MVKGKLTVFGRKGANRS